MSFPTIPPSIAADFFRDPDRMSWAFHGLGAFHKETTLKTMIQYAQTSEELQVLGEFARMMVEFGPSKDHGVFSAFVDACEHAPSASLQVMWDVLSESRTLWQMGLCLAPLGQHDRLDVLAHVLEKTPGIDVSDALKMAVGFGKNNVLPLLLSNISPNTNTRSLLENAISDNNQQAFDLLLPHAPISPNNRNQTLRMCIELHRIKMIEALIPQIQKDHMCVCILQAIESGNNQLAQQFLQTFKPNSAEKNQLLDHAARHNFQMLEYFLQKHDSADRRDQAMQAAISAGNVQAVEFLLNSKPSSFPKPPKNIRSPTWEANLALTSLKLWKTNPKHAKVLDIVLARLTPLDRYHWFKGKKLIDFPHLEEQKTALKSKHALHKAIGSTDTLATPSTTPQASPSRKM